jgi:hypothetical protein
MKNEFRLRSHQQTLVPGETYLVWIHVGRVLDSGRITGIRL